MQGRGASGEERTKAIAAGGVAGTGGGGGSAVGKLRRGWFVA